MFLTEDQIWKLNEIVKEVGYNGGIKIKHERRFKRSGPIIVDYKDQNRSPVRIRVSSTGNWSSV